MITREDTAVYSGSSTTLRARSSLEAEAAAKRRAEEAEAARREADRHAAELQRQYAEYDRQQMAAEEEAERRREEAAREREEIERDAGKLADELQRKERVTRRAREIVSERSFGALDGSAALAGQGEEADASLSAPDGYTHAIAYEDGPTRPEMYGPPERW